jgi:hypothetical protein
MTTLYIYTTVERVEVHISVDQGGVEPTEDVQGVAGVNTGPTEATQEGQPGSNTDTMDSFEEAVVEPLLGDRAWDRRNGPGNEMEQDFRTKPRKSVQELWSKMLVQCGTGKQNIEGPPAHPGHLRERGRSNASFPPRAPGLLELSGRVRPPSGGGPLVR